MYFATPEPPRSFQANPGDNSEPAMVKMRRMAKEMQEYIRQFARYEAVHHTGRWGDDFLDWYTVLESGSTQAHATLSI